MKRISKIMAVVFIVLPTIVFPGILQTAWAQGRVSVPELALSTREIDLGVIGPGEHARGQFQILSTGQGVIQWSMEEPPGWEGMEGKSPSGECGAIPSRVDVVLTSLRERAGQGDQPIELRIASGRQTRVLQRNLAEGTYREALRIESDAGTRTLFVKFTLTDAKSRPSLEVEPRGIDLGDMDPVRDVTRRIRINNRGAGVLKWQAAISGAGAAKVMQEKGRGRYVSMLHEALATGGPYTPPAHIKDTLQLSGNWIAEMGYPKGVGAGSVLRLQFQGTGAVLSGRKVGDSSVILASYDEHPPHEVSLQASGGDRFDVHFDEILTEGLHSLQVQIVEGAAILEGVFIRDARVVTPPPAWARLTPLSGTTTKETDFVTVRVNLSELKPGIYTDYIMVTSNGGMAYIPVSLHLTGEQAPKVVSVYRYVRDDDQLFSSQPDKEDARYLGAYQRSGIAFRLFSPGTAGTVELVRWYNPSIGDHYYSPERSGGRKSLAGYLFEGPIGNIATIRLPSTRELYRWYNPSTGRHFFTTDKAGEGMGRKGYRFEEIVGFVLR